MSKDEYTQTLGFLVLQLSYALAKHDEYAFKRIDRMIDAFKAKNSEHCSDLEKRLTKGA